MEFTPNRKIKYFFGYYNFGGKARPMKWTEEEELVVGGIPTPVIQRHEINEDMYYHTLLVVLEGKYPVRDDVINSIAEPPQTDLT